MEKDTVTKLGLNNYFAWACQVEAILDSKDLWEIVDDGYTEEELEDASEEEKKANKLALAFLKRVVEDCHLEYIGQCKSAKEAWGILRDQFCERDEYQQLVMMKQLLRMEKDEKTPVMEYINKVTSAHREISTAGLINFNDRTLALIILMGLPEEYSDCVRALTRDSKLSVRYIMPVLRAEESRIKMSKEERMKNQELKGYMNRKQPPKFVVNGNNQKTNSSFECFACHKFGHAAKECRKALSAKARGTILCYSCGEEGHSSSVCKQNKTENSGSANNGGGNNIGNVNKSDSKKGGQKFKNNEVRVDVSGQNDEDKVQIGSGVVRVKYKALAGTVTSKTFQETKNDEDSGDPNRWCLDSGCNADCTPFRDLLDNFKPASGTMEVAKKKQVCEVKGVGTVTMRLKDDFGGWTIHLKEVYWVPDASDNLISVRQMDKKGIRFTIVDGRFSAFDGAEEIFNAVAMKDDLYAFEVEWYEQQKLPSCSLEASQSESAVSEPTVTLTARRAVTKEIWHHRFGHANNLPTSDLIPKVLGYPQDKRGYRLWDLNKKCVVLSRNVRFCETIFPFKKIVPREIVEPKCTVQEVDISDFDEWRNDSEENESDNDSDHINSGESSDDESSVHSSVHGGENSVVNSDHESEHEEERERQTPELRRSTRLRHKKECFCCKSVKFNSDCEFCDPETQGLEESKGKKTTLPMRAKFSNKPKLVVETPCDRTEYRSVVGSLRQVANISRPDISYSVCKLSQKFENPSVTDYGEAKHLLKYLKRTKDLSVHYRKTGKPVEVYVDASWGCEVGDKSITGYVVLLAGSPVIWKSVVQKRVAANNNESEIIAMVDVLHEVQWLHIFLNDVGQNKFMEKPCKILGDNRGGILISKGEGISDRTRHCAVETSALKEAVKNNFAIFEYVESEENVADLLTKTLSCVLTSKFCIMLGLS
ncbi:Retrovirus-related Pol polyprotein from transposon RE2 [Frankliniella fusca]|uniref:Retrovirus-related Pol polyprotein from transposon RE2 n=1 Tax=Frankliniella fusca TaxID=407009 RepID=A0AAE1LS41_9NEOP|nr:Retrovirus-related Pol polyprotein from transposon RE2 [Frankliniella fusca]